MTDLFFVDTNVLVYSRDPRAPEKQRAAQNWLGWLWKTGRGRLSTQVLVEYYATVTRKLRPGVPRAAAQADVRSLNAWSPTAPDIRLLNTSWTLEDAHGLSFWDAMIVAAAIEARCRYLLSEDLQDGGMYDAVQVVSPFRHTHDSLPA